MAETVYHTSGTNTSSNHGPSTFALALVLLAIFFGAMARFNHAVREDTDMTCSNEDEAIRVVDGYVSDESDDTLVDGVTVECKVKIVRLI